MSVGDPKSIFKFTLEFSAMAYLEVGKKIRPRTGQDDITNTEAAVFIVMYRHRSEGIRFCGNVGWLVFALP